MVKSASATITGSDSTSAQEITCQPPSVRDSLRAFGIAEAADDDRREHQQHRRPARPSGPA